MCVCCVFGSCIRSCISFVRAYASSLTLQLVLFVFAGAAVGLPTMLQGGVTPKPPVGGARERANAAGVIPTKSPGAMAGRITRMHVTHSCCHVNCWP